MGKDPSAMMAGLLMRRFHSAYLDELKAVREELGEDWVAIRKNRSGRSERYYPVLDGLYKLTREMDECGEALMGDHEGGMELRKHEIHEKGGPESTRGGWPGECSWPWMAPEGEIAEVAREYSGAQVPKMGELDKYEMYFDPVDREAKPKGFWGWLGEVNRKLFKKKGS